MSAGQRGARRERQVMEMLRDDNWIVYRSAGSHGAADLVAMHRDVARPLLLQVKSDVRGTFANFRPRDRVELIREAAQAGADAVLVWWPARREPAFIDSTTWPVSLLVAA